MTQIDLDFINCYLELCRKNVPNHITGIPEARTTIIHHLAKKFCMSEEEAWKKVKAYEKIDMENRKL